jgi:hypothetical protein
LNANATGNALDPNTVSALINNGTEKDNTNIIIGQFTSSLPRERAARGARGNGAARSGRASPTKRRRTSPTRSGRFGTVNFLPTTQFDKRYQAR